MINLHSAKALPTPPQISESEFGAIMEGAKNRYGIVEVTPKTLRKIRKLAEKLIGELPISDGNTLKVTHPPLTRQRSIGQGIGAVHETKGDKDDRLSTIYKKAFGDGIAAVYEREEEEGFVIVDLPIVKNDPEMEVSPIVKKDSVQYQEYKSLQKNLSKFLKEDIPNLSKAMKVGGAISKSVQTIISKIKFLKKHGNRLADAENPTFDNWPHHRSLKNSIETLIKAIDRKLAEKYLNP